MMPNRVLLLVKKELKGLLRDRRTLFIMIFMPVLFYPLLISGLNYFQNIENNKLESLKPVISIKDKQESPLYKAVKDSGRFIIVKAEASENELKDGKIQGILEISREDGDKEKQAVRYSYDSTDVKSRKSMEMLEAVLKNYKQGFVHKTLKEMGKPKNFLEPYVLTFADKASAEKLAGIAFVIIPYFMVISVFAGSISTGLDLTSGEKERGTITTLLTSQLEKEEIVIGKMIVTSITGLISSILSVGGLLIAINYNSNAVMPILPLNVMFPMIAVLLTISFFISSLVIIIGFYSKSVREGSSMTNPLYLVVIFLGVLSTIEGFSITNILYFVPIVNAIFTLKSILVFQFNLTLFLSTLISMNILTVIIICLSVKLCKKEEVLFRA